MIERVRDDISDTASTIGDEIGALGWLLRTAVMAAVAGAIYQELRKPPAERTWQGRLLGFVPYDFRIPSLERVRDSYWNPSSSRIFTDRPLGVGWAVNIPAVLRRLGVMSPQNQRSRRTT
jgi:hypothetical protein